MIIRIERQHLSREYRNKGIEEVDLGMVSSACYTQGEIQQATLVYFSDRGDFGILKNKFGKTGICSPAVVDREMRKSWTHMTH